MAGSGLPLQFIATLDDMVHLFKMSSLPVMATSQMGLSAVVTQQQANALLTYNTEFLGEMHGWKLPGNSSTKTSQELRKAMPSDGLAKKQDLHQQD